MKEVLNCLYSPNVKFIICGDFNLDLYKNRDLQYLRVYEVTLIFNCKPMVKRPTRVTNSTCTLIDQILNFEDAGTCYVFDTVISDHRMVFLELDVFSLDSASHDGKSISRRSFSSANINHFESSLKSEDWSPMYEYVCNDFSVAFEYFYSIVLHYFQLHFPVKKTYIANKNNKWVNADIKTSSMSLKELYYLSRIDPQINAFYLEAKRRHIRLVNNTKKQYYEKKIYQSENKTKALWSAVSELTKNKSQTRNICLNIDGKLIHDPYIVASSINKYFIDETQKKVDNTRKNSGKTESTDKQYKNKFNAFSLFLKPFTEDELFALLFNRIKNKKSAGADDMPLFLLEKILPIIIKPLTYLVNMYFLSGEFPNNLKTGKVIPLHKKKEQSLMKNYRPVTVPESLSKVFEYAFLDRLLTFLNKFHIITRRQHGFQKGKSTGTAMTAFYADLIEYVNSGECPAAIFCDLSGAFDCVDHEVLLDTLEFYGIRGISQKWISSFLQNRMQYVSINYESNGICSNAVSDLISVQRGVPQGTVLGPILFLLYVNQLTDILPANQYTAYADDISLLVSSKDDVNLQKRCRESLTKLIKFLNTRDLFLNTEKTVKISQLST
nr:unnamed protein product [Callosobruchus analis]